MKIFKKNSFLVIAFFGYAVFLGAADTIGNKTEIIQEYCVEFKKIQNSLIEQMGIITQEIACTVKDASVVNSELQQAVKKLLQKKDFVQGFINEITSDVALLENGNNAPDSMQKIVTDYEQFLLFQDYDFYCSQKTNFNEERLAYINDYCIGLQKDLCAKSYGFTYLEYDDQLSDELKRAIDNLKSSKASYVDAKCKLLALEQNFDVHYLTTFNEMNSYLLNKIQIKKNMLEAKSVIIFLIQKIAAIQERQAEIQSFVKKEEENRAKFVEQELAEQEKKDSNEKNIQLSDSVYQYSIEEDNEDSKENELEKMKQYIQTIEKKDLLKNNDGNDGNYHTITGKRKRAQDRSDCFYSSSMSSDNVSEIKKEPEIEIPNYAELRREKGLKKNLLKDIASEGDSIKAEPFDAKQSKKIKRDNSLASEVNKQNMLTTTVNYLLSFFIIS